MRNCRHGNGTVTLSQAESRPSVNFDNSEFAPEWLPCLGSNMIYDSRYGIPTGFDRRGSY